MSLPLDPYFGCLRRGPEEQQLNLPLLQVTRGTLVYKGGCEQLFNPLQWGTFSGNVPTSRGNAPRQEAWSGSLPVALYPRIPQYRLR